MPSVLPFVWVFDANLNLLFINHVLCFLFAPFSWLSFQDCQVQIVGVWLEL